MALVRVIPVEISELQFAQLTSFEEALIKGVTIDRESDVKHISVSSYPSLMFPALTIIKRDREFQSISHIQRVALVYSISLLQEDPRVISIFDENVRIACNSLDEYELRGLDTVTKLNYLTPSHCDETSISSIPWTKDWINSNCRALGLSRSQLAVYALVYALSRYSIKNPLIDAEIKKEAGNFNRYLDKKAGVI